MYEKLSDNNFRQLFLNHTHSGVACGICRESFNRPRYENKGIVKVRDYSNVPQGTGLNERNRAI